MGLWRRKTSAGDGAAASWIEKADVKSSDMIHFSINNAVTGSKSVKVTIATSGGRGKRQGVCGFEKP